MTTHMKPEVGAQVEVTTKWKSTYLFAKSPWEYRTITGTVLKSNYWDAPNTFKVLTGHPIHPEPVISLAHVEKINYIKGKPGKSYDNKSKTKQVTGSKGNVYTVTKNGNKYSCTCPGFTYRRACKHLKLIEE